jgi:hypothetical protein
MSEDRITKEQLLDRIRAERTAWEEVLAAAGEDHLTDPALPGGWSVKDVAAHMVAWRLRAIARLAAARQGTQPPPPPWAGVPESEDFAPINEWIRAAAADRPLAAVLRESRDTLDQLEAAVAATPEADLLDPQRFPWMNGTTLADTVLGNSPEHFFEEHAPVLRAWLAAPVS